MGSDHQVFAVLVLVDPLSVRVKNLRIQTCIFRGATGKAHCGQPVHCVAEACNV